MFPILFSLGPIHLYSFGLFFFLAFAAGSFVIWRYGRKEVSEEFILNLIFYAVVVSLMSGRTAYILSHPEIFESNVLKMFHVFNFPGFSYYWGMITGGLLIVIFSLIKKVNPLKILDFFTLGFTCSLILGYFGCFLNGCLLGVKTNLFWGLNIAGFTGKRHPLPLYEILVLIPLLFLLFKISFRSKKINGLVSAVFFLILGFSQFLLEFLTEGSVYLFNLKYNQIINLFFIFIALILLIKSFAWQEIKEKTLIKKSKAG